MTHPRGRRSEPDLGGAGARYAARVTDAERRTYCRICEAACGLVVDVDADGQPIRLRPDRTHPVSRGYACAKGTRFLEVARHPARLLHPRVDGQNVSWSAAIDAVANRLQPIRDRHGPHAIGVYFGNPMAFNALGLMTLMAFYKSLGTRNVFAAGSQDCNNKFAGARLVHGSAAIHPIPDFERAELAVVFGSNPYVSQSSFVHLPGGATVFDRLIQRGGDVVWVDPRRTESAARWGTHLAIRPGTDAWLLLGLLALVGHRAPEHDRVEGFAELYAAARRIEIGEVARRTGIAAREIHTLAERIAGARGAALHMSVGVNQGGFGTLAYVAMQALSFATGNFDSPGGSLVHPNAALLARIFRMVGIDTRTKSRIGGFTSTLDTMPGAILADEILEPGPERIRALVVIAGDPVRSVPGEARLREALDSLDHLVCIDMFENETGRRADISLPSTSWLERWDFASTTIALQAGGLVQIAGPVLPPPGETRNDGQILAELALALGARHPLWRIARLPLDRWLPRPRFGLQGPGIRPGRWLRRHRLCFFDATMRSEIERLRRTVVDDDAFTLICRRRRLGHNTWLHGGTRTGEPESFAWMRTDDMAALGLHDGAPIELRTSAGSMRIPVRARDGIAPRTVVVPHGLADANVNALIPSGAAHVERWSGQHRMTGISVGVRPL